MNAVCPVAALVDVVLIAPGSTLWILRVFSPSSDVLVVVITSPGRRSSANLVLKPSILELAAWSIVIVVPSTILTSLILPIDVETATKLAFWPFALLTDTNLGSFL